MDTTIFPNPAGSHAIVQGASELMLYDLLGRQVRRGNGEQLNMQSLAPGLYLVRGRRGRSLVSSTLVVR